MASAMSGTRFGRERAGSGAVAIAPTGEDPMIRRKIFSGVLQAVAASGLAALAGAAAPETPDFYVPGGGWSAANVDLLPPVSGPGPVTSDPAHPYIANGGGLQSNFRVADTSSPILQPWAAERMGRDNADVLAGKIGLTARSSCRPAGVPGWEHFIIEPIYFVQTPKEILMLFSGDQQVRHVYMNMPHSANPKPSWYGESVGRYEGDTLVVDTIGFNDKTFVDNYRTPHTDKLHVVERFLRLNGKGLEVDISVDDPGAFTTPWSAIQRYRPVRIAYDEQVCIEGNRQLFDYHVPIADKADF
jgi:hypothetical protein